MPLFFFRLTIIFIYFLKNLLNLMNQMLRAKHIDIDIHHFI